MKNRTFVFVYGTLMQDFGNHQLLDDCEYLGEAETLHPYRMLSLGSFPGVVENLGDGLSGSKIQGELYEVDHMTLTRLDRLEGHPKFYERKRVVIEHGENLVNAWMYLLPADNLRFHLEIEDGDWRAHLNTEEAR